MEPADRQQSRRGSSDRSRAFSGVDGHPVRPSPLAHTNRGYSCANDNVTPRPRALSSEPVTTRAIAPSSDGIAPDLEDVRN